MNNTKMIRDKLLHLRDEINLAPNCNLEFHQQKVNCNSMSFTGGNGRIRINLMSNDYDIILRGKSLEKQMYGFMRNLCGKEHDGYKQTKPEPHAPFWRVSDFGLVKDAIYFYAKTKM